MRALKKPPALQRDEFILLLDLYIRHSGKRFSPDDPEIKELSGVLRRLPIHPERLSMARFRTPDGVVMQLLTLRSCDSAPSGVALNRGSQLAKEVWDEFAGQPEHLHKIAESIREGCLTVRAPTEEDPDEESFPEGRILYRIHKQRERDREVIEKAKAKMLQRGPLSCCICKFDFAARYGKIGEGFIEGHHTKPLADLTRETKTRVEDIALVCSNCHRMLHRKRPWLTIAAMSSLLVKRT